MFSLLTLYAALSISVPVILFAQITGEDPAELARIVYDAIVHKNWWGVAAGVLVLTVWALRVYGARWFPKLQPWLNNPIVAFVLPIVVSSLGAVLTTFIAFGWAMTAEAVQAALIAGLKVAIGAVWAYVGAKKVVEVRAEARAKADAQVVTTADAIAVHTGRLPPNE